MVTKLDIARIITPKFLQWFRGIWLLMEPWSYRKNVSLSPKCPHSTLWWDKMELILGSQIQSTEQFKMLNRSR